MSGRHYSDKRWCYSEYSQKTLISGGGICGAIHEAAGLGLLHEGQKLNGCETGDCEVKLGYKLPANYVFHTLDQEIKMTLSWKISMKVVYRMFSLIM